jgi:hypothetical protein
LRKFEERVERERKKGERGRLGEWEGMLQSYRPKQENLSGRLEKYARVCVDLDRRGEGLVRAVEGIAEPVSASAPASAGGVLGRRSGTRTQTDGSSFEPTLPGTTERGDEDGEAMVEVEVESTLDRFKAIRRQEEDVWTSKSLHDRYASDRGYAEFKAMEFEGYHDDEQEDAPGPETWFATEEPAPGTATQGAADDSDDDVQIARAKISTKCPLTLQEFKVPVMSTKCKHTFEKSAIEEMIGRRLQVQCPCGGCPNVRSPLSYLPSHFYHLLTRRKFITRAQLEPNDKLLRKIRRIQQSRNRHREELDDDETARTGGNADTSILLSDDGPVAGGFRSLDVSELKRERVSQSQRRSDDEDEVTDGDTEDE